MENLDLNDADVYRCFRTDKTPRYIDQMPLLISGKNLDGKLVDSPRLPVEVENVFERRLNSSKPDWMDNWFDTGTGLVVPARDSYDNRRFKIRRKSESLREVNPKSELIEGGISHNSYEAVPGVEFIAGKDGVIVDRDMTKDETLNNPALLVVLGGDTSFRDAVVNKIFYEGQKRFNDPNLKMMGIYLQSELKQANEKAFCVYGLDVRSGLDGRLRLADGGGHLVGYLAPEAPNAHGNTVQRVAIPERKILTVSEVLEEAMLPLH